LLIVAIYDSTIRKSQQPVNPGATGQSRPGVGSSRACLTVSIRTSSTTAPTMQARLPSQNPWTSQRRPSVCR